MTQSMNFSDRDLLQEMKLSLQLPALLDRILSDRIITRTATEVGITVELEELQQAADRIRLTHNLASAATTYAWLEKYGLSLDDFEALVQRSCLTQKLAQYLFADKVDAFFAQHQLDYASAVLYEILLDDEDQAWELFYELQAGEQSFSQLAYEYIHEVELRRVGGYLGKRRRSELKPEISAAVFAAKPPQVLKPVVTASTVHLIQVEEILQPQLDEPLRSKILMDLFDEWLEEQKRNLQESVA